MRNLNQLYILLLDVIKDKDYVNSLDIEANVIFINDEITKEEYQLLSDDIHNNWQGNILLSNTENRKNFVKGMIAKSTLNLKSCQQ